MINIKKYFTLILAFLTLPLLYSFSSHSFCLSGLTSFSTALPEFGNKVFLRPDPKLKIEARTEEQRVKNKIRKVISKYRAGLGMKSLKHVPHRIYQESKKYDYDPLFLTALIVTESSFNNWAKSSKGALGLMQIKPRTGHAMATAMGTLLARCAAGDLADLPFPPSKPKPIPFHALRRPGIEVALAWKRLQDAWESRAHYAQCLGSATG